MKYLVFLLFIIKAQEHQENKNDLISGIICLMATQKATSAQYPDMSPNKDDNSQKQKVFNKIYASLYGQCVDKMNTEKQEDIMKKMQSTQKPELDFNDYFDINSIKKYNENGQDLTLTQDEMKYLNYGQELLKQQQKDQNQNDSQEEENEDEDDEDEDDEDEDEDEEDSEKYKIDQEYKRNVNIGMVIVIISSIVYIFYSLFNKLFKKEKVIKKQKKH